MALPLQASTITAYAHGSTGAQPDRNSDMVQLFELIPDPDDVIALEPEELGLRLLPVLASIRHPLPPLEPDRFFAMTFGSYRRSSR
jgi:hypothetical protein